MQATNIEWTETGRSVASNGYVLIRVGKDHPLADCRGYAYEHRLVASKSISRWVTPSEQVHHRNEVKTDNRPENLEVVAGIAEHRLRHRKPGSRRRLPGESNVVVACACGFGETFDRFDANGRPREHVTGHNRQPLGEFADMLLYYLEHVPLPSHTQYIASVLGEDRGHVTATLSRLRARGLVERHGREWRLCG